MIFKRQNLKRTSMQILLSLFLIVANTYAQNSEEEVINKGVDYYNKKMYDEAITEFTKAIQINPNSFIAYGCRGATYQAKGDLNQALLDYNKVIEMNPNDALAYYNKGVVNYIKGNLDQALLDYNKVIEIDPNLAKAYYDRGRAYFLKHEYNKSWEDVHKAESLGFKVDSKFLEDLKIASEREK